MPKTRNFKELYDKMSLGKKRAVKEAISGELEQEITPNVRVKISSLRYAIYHILLMEKMTTDELVSHLLSEPGIELEDLKLITIALNGLRDDDLLRVSFRTNSQKLNIEPVFRSTSRRP